jgi:hypothetical protein
VPSALVVETRVKFVAVWVSVTVAPGMTAPVESETLPYIVVVLSYAGAAATAKRAMHSDRKILQL